MPDRFFLNALSKDRQLPAPKPGTWNQKDSFLGLYAGDIEIEGDLEDREVVASLPSVFARPIQFYQALNESEHPLHAAIVDQWRGLLGVLALRRVHGFEVEATAYEVPPEQPTPTAPASKGGVGDLHLTTILRNQLPHPDSDWEKWWLLRCGGRLVGATSPWSVVYTPAEYRCPPSIPWQKDGLLFDPLRYFAGQGESARRELSILLRWVELMLAAHPWGMDTRLEQEAGTVHRELKRWRDGLRPYHDSDCPVSRLIPDPVALPVEPYSHFLFVPDLAELPPVASDFRITGSDGAQTLVLSRTSLEGQGRVDKSIFADQLDLSEGAMPGPGGPSGWPTRTGYKVAHPYVIAEEAFLSPKLVKLKLTEQSLSRGSDEYALPLTPAYFRYLDFAGLVADPKMLSVEPQKGGDVVVHLRIPLESGRVLQVTRRYQDQTDIIQVEGGTPALGVWPDFMSNDWLQNFAVCTSGAESNLSVAPILADGTTLPRTGDGGQEHPTRIWPSKKPVIGFAVYPTKAGSAAENANLGVVMSAEARPAVAPSGDRAWKVAVDFGTSSTHVMYSRNGGYEPLHLQGRTRILAGGPGNREEAIRSLYPEAEVVPPFVTLLSRTEATFVRTGEAGSRQFTPQFNLVPDPRTPVANLIENVKWGSGAGRREDIPIRDYLKGVATYILCEAVAQGAGKLTFEWSYPMAMPQQARETMAGFWEQAWAGVIREAAIRDGRIQVEISDGTLESEAVCRYLTDQQLLYVHADSLSIAVDVGGGSSDIAFWRQGELLDQVSFKLASNDLVVPLAEHGLLMAELYRVCTSLPITAQDLKEHRKRAAIICNVLLTEASHESDDPNRHPVVTGLQSGDLLPGEPPWLEARSLAYLLFTGLSYYLGLHSQCLNFKADKVNVYFGGRGSSLLSWIGRGNRDRVRETMEFAFTEGWNQAADGSHQVSVRFHGPAINFEPKARPKNETVSGLLSPMIGTSRVSDTEIAKRVLLGEVGWTRPDGSEVPWNERIDVEGIKALSPPPNYDTGHIAHFIDRVVPRFVTELGLDDSKLPGLTVDTNAVQGTLRQRAMNEQVLQPIFGGELKALIDEYLRRVLPG